MTGTSSTVFEIEPSSIDDDCPYTWQASFMIRNESIVATCGHRAVRASLLPSTTQFSSVKDLNADIEGPARREADDRIVRVALCFKSESRLRRRSSGHDSSRPREPVSRRQAILGATGRSAPCQAQICQYPLESLSVPVDGPVLHGRLCCALPIDHSGLPVDLRRTPTRTVNNGINATR